MSEHYSKWYEPFLLALLLMVAFAVLSINIKSELLDLQRRVGTLEQKK